MIADEHHRGLGAGELGQAMDAAAGSGNAKSAARQPKGRSWLDGAAIVQAAAGARAQRRLDDADHLGALGAVEHRRGARTVSLPSPAIACASLMYCTSFIETSRWSSGMNQRDRRAPSCQRRRDLALASSVELPAPVKLSRPEPCLPPTSLPGSTARREGASRRRCRYVVQA